MISNEAVALGVHPTQQQSFPNTPWQPAVFKAV